MKVQALWIVAHNTLEKGIAVLGGAKTCLHLLACNIDTMLTTAACRIASSSLAHCSAACLPPQTTPLTASMHLVASSCRLKVMYALPVGPFLLADAP